MTPKTMWSPAGVVKLALGSVLALAATAGTVHAQSKSLTCGQTNVPQGQAPATHTFRINYATGLVEELAPSGKPYTNRIAPNARISDNAIVWHVKLLDTGLQKPVPMVWEGTIDRLSGTGWTEFSREPDWMVYRETFTCHEATPIF